MLTIVPSKTVGRSALLFAACLVGSSLYAQDFAASGAAVNSVYTYQAKTKQLQTLGEILQQIEKQHDVSFICRSELLEMKINTGKEDFREKAFVHSLVAVIKPYGLDLKQITDQQFAISATKEEGERRSENGDNMEPLNAYGQNISMVNGVALDVRSWGAIRMERVSGTVRGTGNQLLPGVTVTVKGTGNGTVTNADGRFGPV